MRLGNEMGRLGRPRLQKDCWNVVGCPNHRRMDSCSGVYCLNELGRITDVEQADFDFRRLDAIPRLINCVYRTIRPPIFP